MKKNLFMAIILVVLVLISFVQAFQLNSLKNKLADSSVSIDAKSGSTAVASGGSSGGSASLPSNIQNLPTMVGGC